MAKYAISGAAGNFQSGGEANDLGVTHALDFVKLFEGPAPKLLNRTVFLQDILGDFLRRIASSPRSDEDREEFQLG